MRFRVLTLVTAVIAVTSAVSVMAAGPGHAAAAQRTTAGWHVGLTLPAVTTTSDYLSCGSATQCQAVGATVGGSSLMRTGDGGKTWTGEPMPAGIAGLGPVSCGSAAACQVLAVTSANKLTIIGTTNGGASWTTEQIPAGTGLSAVSCASPSDCHAAGLTNAAGAMLGTINGGKTWTAESLPSGVDQVYDVACASATSCQAVGVSGGGSTGVILGTSNGGKTWTVERSLGSTLMFVIVCGTSSSCQALGETSHGASAVLGTSNSGKTWTSEQFASGQLPMVVSCTSASACVAGGQSAHGPFTAATANGGKTWQTTGTPGGFSAINSISCHSWCVAAGEGTTGIGVFATSANAGRTWTAGRLPLEFYSLNALACPAGCLAAGASAYGGAAVSALAGGQLPSAGTQLLSSGASLAGASCQTATCVTVGPNGGWVSADGGKTWGPAHFPAGTGALSAVSCGSAASCVAVGRGKTAVSTADGGKTWRADTLPAGTYALSGVSCGSATACMAIGEGVSGARLVLVTTNAGQSWSTFLPPVRGPLTTVTCGSATSCHIAGQTVTGGAIELNTANGGKTWSAGSLPATVTSVTGLACASAVSCDALAGTATGQNEVLGTTNSGQSWTAQTVPAEVSGLTAITCDGSSGCEVAGTDAAGETVVLRPGAAATTLPRTATRPPIATAKWHEPSQARAGVHATSATPASFKAVSLNWISAQQGWMLGTAPCGSKTCSDVLNTSDGGRSWSVSGTIPAPIPQPFNGAGVTKIAETTPDDGWAFGPDLFATTNGGQSWTSQTIPGGAKQVMALATNPAGTYILTSPCPSGSGSCTPKSLTLWRRSGTSWTKLSVTVPTSFAPVLTAYGNTVYVGGPNSGNGASFLFASTDGVHFTARKQPCDASQALALVSIAPTSASRVALLCDGNPGFSQAVKTVYLSADTGKTDHYAGMLGNIGIQAQLTESPSGNLAVASSSDGSFIYINDSRSTTWTMPVGFGDGGLGWGDIQYVTDNTAWVVYSPGNEVDGLGKVLVTRDGGRHWTLAAL